LVERLQKLGLIVRTVAVSQVALAIRIGYPDSAMLIARRRASLTSLAYSGAAFLD
jgi:hypothetical protein